MSDRYLKVLLIEDSLGDARLIMEMITEVSSVRVKIDHSFRLSAGLDRLAGDKYDVVLLDLNLPDSFGLDTIKKLNNAFPSVPIVVLTGHEDEELGLSAVQTGAQDYLVKLQIDSNGIVRSLRYAIERKKTEEKLSESSERFNALFNHPAVGISHISVEGKWIEINHRLCDFLGYSRQELMTMNSEDITYPEDINAGIEDRLLVANGTLPFYTVEKRYVHKTGAIVWARNTVSPMRDRQGNLLYYVTVTEDINRIKQLEESMHEHEKKN